MGLLITFEGPEGSGKTSHIPLLSKFLQENGYKVFSTREPGGTPIGDQIREVVMSLGNKEMHPRTEILLFQASRAQLVEQEIKPHLNIGDIVLCDRYSDSTLAYQGYGHGVNLDELRHLINFATGGLSPNLTILLDVDINVGLQRRNLAGEWNRMDDYEVEFHRRVRAGYLEMVKQEPKRWIVIDAGQSWKKVQEDLRLKILSVLLDTK